MLIDGDELNFRKLELSISKLKGSLHVSITDLIERVVPGLYSGVTKTELLTLLSETSASMATRHPDYSFLASRIASKCLYMSTPARFSEAMAILADSGTVTMEIASRSRKFDTYIDHSRDNDLTYFGFKTLSNTYLLRKDRKIIERPQHLFMRVALGVHHDDDEKAIETYELMSRRFFIHATPTLFNAGTIKHQYSSCFLKAVDDDSIEGIFETLKECAIISKHSGGIGLHVSNVRAKNSAINQSGAAGGLVPMLRVFNNMARYVDQGGNKRPGAISITLEPWHADLLDFLDLRKNHGKDEYRARDLFYALWVPDLFMQTVKENGTWYLFSPDTAPGLADVYGEEFEDLYNQYVDDRKYVASYPAQKLWSAIMVAQIETGNPSILYKDSSNRKSNQNNLGTIKSSNLCTEIIEYSSAEETAVCNLASLALPQFIKDDCTFDMAMLHKVTKLTANNLDKIIDINFYPLPGAEKSNKRNRPMGIGVQGLADVYMKMGIPFDSNEASDINFRIFETIYHAALEQSCELAEEFGPYDTFEGSPASKGKLQFDLWDHKISDENWDWTSLRDKIKRHGLRNSLVTALMPTASTSQILGCNECFEPLTSNTYSRRVLSGEYQLVNKYLVDAIEPLGLWTPAIRQRIMADNGSVQKITEIPAPLREVFKTVWEIKQKHIIDQSAARGIFIDQSQSMNIFLAHPSERQLTSMHFHGWKMGLKTGLYYLRTLPASMPTPVTLEHHYVTELKASSCPASPRKRVKYESDLESCEICSS